MEKEVELNNVELDATASTATEAPKKRGRKKVETSTPVEEEIVHPMQVEEEKAKAAKKKATEEKKGDELVNPNQLNVLKLALGWNESNPLRYPAKGSKYDKAILYSYRNRFFSDYKPQLEDLVVKGLMEHHECGINGITHKGYKVTEAGVKYLAEKENITIKITVPRRGDDYRSKKS